VIDEYQSKLTSAAQAVSHIRSGDGVYIHSNAGAPPALIAAMTARAGDLRGVQIYQLITLGTAPYADPGMEASFNVHAMFIGPNVRAAVKDGRADYTPIFFSELPDLFYSGRLKVDVCLIETTPPDADGNLSMGVSLDCTLAARKHSRLTIVQVNRHMPRTHGKSRLHVSEVDFIVEADHALPNLHITPVGSVETGIAANVASLVEDGATIQMGIGAIPNAVLLALHDKNDLGVHSEMVSDGIIPLVKSGVVNGKRKTVLPERIAVSFMMGSQELYDFVDDNKMIEFHPSEFINDPQIISQNYRMTSINAALQIDLTGQVCADSIGTDLYSGCGGQVDFIRGARRSAGGKAIVALPSTARKGTVSRISPVITPGGGIVTSRADVQYVVTEYGIAQLYGTNMKERVDALISIAHPDFRDFLMDEAKRFAWYKPPVIWSTAK
jgi:4-hydroxybutyrate CoA-transferase